MTTPAPPVPRRAKPAASKQRRAARDEIKKGVKHLETSIREIQKGLRAAEQQIEADARKRIRTLRKDATAELAALRRRHRDVARILDKVSAAAEGSWQKVKKTADARLADAIGAATSVVKRLNKALPR
jgi:prefoldin subunit 5